MNVCRPNSLKHVMPDPSNGCLHEQLNREFNKLCLVQSALTSHGSLIQGSGTAWGMKIFTHKLLEDQYRAHIPMQENPSPVNPGLHTQVKFGESGFSCAQLALGSQGPSRHGSGTVEIHNQSQKVYTDNIYNGILQAMQASLQDEKVI